MTGGPGPDEQQPEALTPDDPHATKPDGPEEEKGRSLVARIPGGRTLLTVVAAIVAVTAIAATTWALARNGGDDTATPIDDESGAVTFGPNQPDTTSTTSLPTSPTFPSLPTTPTTPTFPTSQFSFPSASVPPATYPTSRYTYPTYATSQYTFPTSTYVPTTPTSGPTTPTSTPPTKTEVVPVAPQATRITKCGTYGSLRFAQTEGVRYSLVVGDGKKGRYVVTAQARKGYVIADGATRRFTGNLGRYRECPLGFKRVVAKKTDGAWDVKVRLWVPEKEDRALRVSYSFATQATLVSWAGDGWECGDLTDGVLDCTYAGDGTPPTLTARVTSGKGGPAGTVGLYAESEEIDVAAFDGSDQD